MNPKFGHRAHAATSLVALVALLVLAAATAFVLLDSGDSEEVVFEENPAIDATDREDSQLSPHRKPDEDETAEASNAATSIDDTENAAVTLKPRLAVVDALDRPVFGIRVELFPEGDRTTILARGRTSAETGIWAPATTDTRAVGPSTRASLGATLVDTETVAWSDAGEDGLRTLKLADCGFVELQRWRDENAVDETSATARFTLEANGKSASVEVLNGRAIIATPLHGDVIVTTSLTETRLTVGGPTRPGETKIVRVFDPSTGGAVFSGRLVDFHGEPLREAAFRVFELRSDSDVKSLRESARPQETDAEGVFRFRRTKNGPSAIAIRISTTARGDAKRDPDFETLHGTTPVLELAALPTEIALGDIALGPTITICRGKVVDDLGRPVASARVIGSCETARGSELFACCESSTDVNGSFETRSSCRHDNRTLTAIHPSGARSPRVPFRAGTADLEIVAPRAARVVGRLVSDKIPDFADIRVGLTGLPSSHFTGMGKASATKAALHHIDATDDPETREILARSFYADSRLGVGADGRFGWNAVQPGHGTFGIWIGESEHPVVVVHGIAVKPGESLVLPELNLDEYLDR